MGNEPGMPQGDGSPDAKRTAHERKQHWKEQAGNRYTAEELRLMSQTLGRIRIVEQELQVMKLD